MKRLVLAVATLSLVAAPAWSRTVLFMGNSFTFGANSPVLRFHARDITDLNKAGFGGVPALFLDQEALGAYPGLIARGRAALVNVARYAFAGLSMYPSPLAEIPYVPVVV